ncbi:hypothetical protein D5272_10295 [bacterium D16-76]|nr:hypothetical protein [bacterium D16-76]
MPQKRKIHYHEHDPLPEGKFPNISGVASANECTGLMYKTPADRQELHAYRDLFSMEIPQDAPGESPQRPRP